MLPSSHQLHKTNKLCKIFCFMIKTIVNRTIHVAVEVRYLDKIQMDFTETIVLKTNSHCNCMIICRFNWHSNETSKLFNVKSNDYFIVSILSTILFTLNLDKCLIILYLSNKNYIVPHLNLWLTFSWIPVTGADTTEAGEYFSSLPTCSSANWNWNFCSINMRPAFVCIIPIHLAMHLRGPSPNFALWSLKRSGLNSWGTFHYFGSWCIAKIDMRIGVPVSMTKSGFSKWSFWVHCLGSIANGGRLLKVSNNGK